ncbi:hypothetical protein GCM10022377_25120 [Zhihengliuella alba]|uniref:DUF4232 domain-containing protein n=1 Tax=Zhihengliuella alba TaxID=547018 RepID=A0ABP7DXI3_9MICC
MSSSAPSPRRPSPAVYRRRRLVALVALLVVLALLVWGVSAVVGMVRGNDAGPTAQAGGEAGASAPADPSASGAPGPSDGTVSGAAGDCQPDDVVVRSSTDAASYGPDANPVLIMTIENTGEAPCDVNVGTGEQEFLVMSGDDRIFSTKDCLAEASDLRITMEPGQAETARFTWERVRSAPGCEPVSSNPRPGTYGFTAKLGDRESKGAVFQLQ